MKPWHITLLALVLAGVSFLGWLIASYRKGRNEY